jgi:hypothetical protein
MAGGYNGPAYLNEVGLYTGSTWTTGSVMPYVGGLFAVGGMGTQTAGLIAGGEPGTKNTTLEFDGTNWSSGGTLNTARYWAGAAGLQTAGLIFGGEAVPAKTDATESYNGTSWTTLPATTTVTTIIDWHLEPQASKRYQHWIRHAWAFIALVSKLQPKFLKLSLGLFRFYNIG